MERKHRVALLPRRTTKSLLRAPYCLGKVLVARFREPVYNGDRLVRGGFMVPIEVKSILSNLSFERNKGVVPRVIKIELMMNTMVKLIEE